MKVIPETCHAQLNLISRFFLNNKNFTLRVRLSDAVQTISF
jgi:hypothetical protein